MKLLWAKNNLFQSPSPKILTLEMSRFARPSVCAPILSAGFGVFFPVVSLGHACGLRDRSSTKADKGLEIINTC